MILKPLVSEKSMAHASLGIYTFIIDPTFTKPQIGKIIHDLFNVDVHMVRLLNRKGKTKRYKKIAGKRSDIRIAMIHIDPKQKIDGFEIEASTKENNPVTSSKEIINKDSL